MWAKLLLIPRHHLYAGIALFCALGVILGPLAETSFRNALLSPGGVCSILIASPVTWTFYGLMLLAPDDAVDTPAATQATVPGDATD